MPLWILLPLVFLFAHPFALYPAFMLLWQRRAAARQSLPDPEEWPSVALVVCALNEVKVIRDKVENSLALEYPGRLQPVFISDGSTDGTTEIIAEYVDRGVELIANPARRGKTSNLNDAVPARSERIVVLSDANVLYHPQAIQHLVRALHQPGVGCASGKVVLENTTGAIQGAEESFYSVEWSMQEMETRIYSMVGVDGAMYALWRECFRPVPNDTLIDDYVIATGVLQQGKRVVFEPRALAWENGPATVKEEFRRKIRIAAGAAQSLLRGNGLPWGTPARFWLLFVSHKLLRWLSPVVALALAAACLAYWTTPLAMAVLAGMAALTAAALLRMATNWSNPLLDAAYYFLMGQVAIGWGLWKGFTGTQSILWAKANR